MLLSKNRRQKYLLLLRDMLTLSYWKELFIPDDPKEHPRLVRFVFFNAILLLILTLVIFIISFLFVRNGTPKVRVPGVEDLNLMDAAIAIQSSNLILHIEPRFSTKHQRYEIIKQYPSRGTMMREGRGVTLVVSLGTDEYIIPPISGMSKKEALLVLEKDQIPYKIQTIAAETRKSDLIMGTSIPTGTRVSRDIPVTIFVADNTKKNFYQMENFVGELAEFTLNLLDSEKIVPIIRTENVSNQSDDGIILEQNVPKGSIIPHYSSIVLTIGLYPRDIAESQQLKWHYFKYNFPKLDVNEVIAMTNSYDEITYITPEAPTAKHYKVVLDDELGRSSLLYEKMGAEGSSLVQLFKGYGRSRISVYADDQLVSTKEFKAE